MGQGQTFLKDVLRIAVDIELECAAVYEVFAQHCADHAELSIFWRLYAEAERDLSRSLNGELTVEEIYANWLGGVVGPAYVVGTDMIRTIEHELGRDAAVAIANDTCYGLQASLYTSNVTNAHRYARALQAGTISVNCYAEGDIATPFGGYKLSGFGGRDNSLQAHEQYCETKTIWIDLSDDPIDDTVTADPSSLG